MSKKVKPISSKKIKHNIPDFIIKTVNNLLKKKWNGKEAIITQDEILDIVSSTKDDDSRPTRSEIFKNNWLDIEDIYEKYGWNVKYDNESPASFSFTKKK